MNEATKRTIRLILNGLLVVLVTSGIISQAVSSIIVGSGAISFLYFTTQSNLIMVGLSLVLIYFDLKRKPLPRFLQIFHHLAVVATTLTFLVFALMLGPFLDLATYFYSLQNIALHNLGPILAIIVYLLYAHETPKSVKLLALIGPLSYMFVTYLLYFSGVRFHPYELPYFFLEYMTYGWLRIDFPNFGILYWWVAIILLIFIISYLVYLLKRKAQTNSKVIYISASTLFVLSLTFIVINTIMKL